MYILYCSQSLTKSLTVVSKFCEKIAKLLKETVKIQNSGKILTTVIFMLLTVPIKIILYIHGFESNLYILFLRKSKKNVTFAKSRYFNFLTVHFIL